MGKIQKVEPMYERKHKGYSLSYTQDILRPNSSNVAINHTIIATHKGKTVGHLEWYNDEPEITNIHVDEKHRRKGLATAMYDMARNLPTKEGVEHSPIRTDAGEAWSRTTKGYYPRQENERHQYADEHGDIKEE